MVAKREGVGERMKWEVGVSRCVPLYRKWINNKILWYRMRNCIRYPVNIGYWVFKSVSPWTNLFTLVASALSIYEIWFSPHEQLTLTSSFPVQSRHPDHLQNCIPIQNLDSHPESGWMRMESQRKVPPRLGWVKDKEN